MKVLALKIRGFRGITEARLVFDDHFVLVGPNGVGKSTVIDALSLVFGRSRLVPTLTEHDFHGSCPGRAARISIVVTLGGFSPDDPESHRGQWFRQGRGVEKFWSTTERKAVPERTAVNEPLCVEIGFCARFDHDELIVDQIRYFHDDDATTDPFDDGVTPFPNALLNEVGFYVLPARRTWEMTVSFASELFRKAVTIVGGIPANAVLDIRDTVRAPAAPIETDAALKPLVEAVNTQLARLLPGQPQLQIRLTATDSESVLKALVPHYAFPGVPSLPAGRHGGGLLALQTLILLLETGRARRAAGQSFILALEEPELHVPPGLQRQIVSEARTIANQTICTTHAPRVGACYTADRVHVMRRAAGNLATNRLLDGPDLNLANAARKLLVDERMRLLEALMYPRVLVPEGRIDFEFLRLFVEVAHGSENGASRFETEVGTVPTPDSHVVGAVTRLTALRDGVFAVVDGDAAGDSYVTALISLPSPPLLVIQWPQGWTIEDVVAWVAAADPDVVTKIGERVEGPQITTPSDLSARLKSDDRTAAGLKQHYLAYEEVAFALRDVAVCASRATNVLEALADVASRRQSALFVADDARSSAVTSVLRFQPA
jgi:energy-coupling factor transporter ATP-binding protein EcfA2